LESIGFTSLAARSLQGKSQLVEQPLALPHTEGDGVVFFEMVREKQTIPQILVIPQFPGRKAYFASQPFSVSNRKPGGASGAIPFPQSGKAVTEKPMNPIFDSPGRVSVQTCRFIRTGSLEDVEHDVEPVKVSPFTCSRYFVLNGGDKCFCIRNSYPFHWKHPLNRFAPSIL
jgi:hypothetical protein